MVRWVVEAVNGRLKKKFKIFRGEMRAGYFEQLHEKSGVRSINFTCSALCQDSDRSLSLATRALDLVASRNILQQTIAQHKWNILLGRWVLASASNANSFPQLDQT